MKKVMEEMKLYYLRTEVQGVIKHFAEAERCPTNYVATAILTAVGAVAGKRLIIEDGAYINYGQLYTCLVGVPGAAKSPAMNVVMRPIDEIDYTNYLSYRRAMADWNKDEGGEKPKLRKIACDDVTTEQLLKILAQNDNGVMFHADELTDLTKNLNRYSNGDNLPKFLKIWSNGSVRVDRKNDEPLMVKKPFLSILSATQPVNIPKIFAAHTGTGYFSRWLFALPNEKPQTRIEPQPHYYQYWADMVAKLHDLDEIRLTFDDLAKRMLDSFDTEIEQNVAYCVRNGMNDLAEYIEKQGYTIRRLAGIVHLISCENDIMKDDVSQTISSQEYVFAECLVRFFIDCAKEVLEMIAKESKTTITNKDLIKVMFERFEIKNISEFARAIGTSHQYISRIRGE